MIQSKELHALIARAREDGTRAFFFVRQSFTEKFEQAIKDFEPYLPYPVIWWVYRSRYAMALRDKRLDFEKRKGYTKSKRFHRGQQSRT